MTGIPEPQAYMIAFSGLSAAGLTKQRLLETANKYLGIVDREIQDFDASFNQMYDTEVTSVEKSITAKTQEIADLTQKITKLNTEVGELRTRVMTNTQRLSDKKNGFMMAGTAQKQEIQNEITKINQYIQ
jgi:chromosome segregation ATPase